VADGIAMVDQAAVRQSLHDALAILVAGAGVPQLSAFGKSPMAASDSSMIWRPIAPFRDFCNGGIERHGTMKRCSMKMRYSKNLASTVSARMRSHSSTNGGNCLYCSLPSRVKAMFTVADSRDDLGDLTESGQVGLHPAAQLELEMAQAVKTRAVLKRLWQTVVEALLRFHVGSGERIGYPNGMARDDSLQRFSGQNSAGTRPASSE